MSYTCLLLQLTEVNNSKVMNNQQLRIHQNQNLFISWLISFHIFGREGLTEVVYKTMKIEENISTGIQKYNNIIRIFS